MKFFIDSNIIISSALFPNGKSSYVFSRILEEHEVVISTYVIDECRAVFRRKFPEKTEYLDAFLNKITYTRYQSPESFDSTLFPELRDPNDLPVLVAAVLSDSDILLTGDKDSADLRISKPLIFTPTEYYDLLSKP